MWIYYGLILISVVMFGGGFALQDLYREKRGSRLIISMEVACIGSLAGLVVLLIINGFSFDFSAFTILMAAFAAINAIAFIFCTFKALEHINLSLFSLYAMLGGMMLPFLQGILFFNEGFTPAKGICVAFICLALICTVERSENRKGAIFYAGIFVLNGMSGVISKLFTAADFPKSDAAGYSIWVATMTACFSGLVWIMLVILEKHRSNYKADLIPKEPLKIRLGAYGICALCGTISQVANFLLVIALAYVDASVQYPMITGGTMIVSTILSCFRGKIPKKREILSVGFAFVGMLLLFLLSA